MSVESMGLVLNHSRAKGTAKLVLLGIANHDGDGGSWPSVATLATYANTSERSVQAHLATLVQLGEIVIHYNEGGTHKTRSDRRPNRYQILIRKPVDNPADGVQNPASRKSDGVQDHVARGAGSRTDGVQEPAPEPSLNHPEPPAAAGGRVPVKNLPDEIQKLRDSFTQSERLKNLSFTGFTPAEVEDVSSTVRRLGVKRMTDVAHATYLGARSARAFIETWLAVRTVAVVEDSTEPRCPVCSRTLTACKAADRKVPEADRCTGRNAS